MKSNLFAYGFRSQFLLAGLAGLLLVPLWALSFVVGLPVGSGWPPTLWHAHEMLFGFIISAIAGFMLTAVPSWTGQKGFAGRPLIVLALLWLAARVLIASPALWPALLVSAIDLAFLPVLALFIAWPLLRENNRNTPLLGILGVLWLSNLVFHLGVIRHDTPLALHAAIVGIDIVLILVTVIGGRIIPAFTTAALRPTGMGGLVHSRLTLTVLSVAAMALVAIVDVFWPDTRLAGMIAAAAACLQGLRLLQWATLRTLRQPIVWVLHLAYAWLPVGLALKAVALLAGSAIAAFWLHALTIGAVTTMILGVMTRASLGHTGRALVVDRLIALAYALLTAAAVVRVFGLSGLGLSYPAVIIFSSLFWTAAFAIFVAVYAPILWMPRADGKAG
ncbi:MAG: NnrS family protein [Steroidobacteraceae bacterium]